MLAEEYIFEKLACVKLFYNGRSLFELISCLEQFHGKINSIAKWGSLNFVYKILLLSHLQIVSIYRFFCPYVTVYLSNKVAVTEHKYIYGIIILCQ